MNRFLLFTVMYFIGIGLSNAAVRDASSIARTTGTSTNVALRASGATITPRSGNNGTASRTTTTGARGASSATAARNGVSTTSARTATTVRSTGTTTTARSGAITPTTSRAATSQNRARATSITATASKTFGTGYNACRDAYFTCMDQFCAVQNDTYRRCVCSSRLDTIKSRERLLGQTATQLQDFADLNIDVIPKTAGEVKAMMSETAGEAAANNARDKSASAQSLAGISAVLSTAKSKALSTQGTLDIAGDINAIWATTDLASGAAIANLTGEPLYNAVHAQCVKMVQDECTSTSILNMVVSAYGMYIENDCTLLLNSLNKKTNEANASIREAEHQMNSARLENYNAHNSTSINNCIAQVRSDITADTACGQGYVHCLDVSGKYLNRDTGAPIYTADFYQLSGTIFLSGDVLNNQTNRLIVAELNNKRVFAKRGLDTCRDLADEVWDEFMRQAIAEIYQGQQNRIRQVKTECLDVVSNCYDEQNQSLKDFSNIKEQLLLGQRMELSEEMCKEKLNACANLYSNGKGGMTELLIAMHDIVSQQIGQACLITLQDYAKDICAVSSNDSLHSYPYGCRVYRPGSQKYASILQCNSILYSESAAEGGGSRGGDDDNDIEETPSSGTGYSCPSLKIYLSCNAGYYLKDGKCNKCAANQICPGGTSGPIESDSDTIIDGIDCGDYPGSLYQKLVRYARETCVRPSLTSNDATPDSVLQDVNIAMDSIRVDMGKTLSNECTRLGGTWINTAHDKNSTNNLLQAFYKENSAHTDWGYCADPMQSLQKSCEATKRSKLDFPSESDAKKRGKGWDENTQTCDCGYDMSWSTSSNKCEYNAAKLNCQKQGNQWNDATSTCNCANDNLEWDPGQMRCVQRFETKTKSTAETRCEEAKGTWNDVNMTCSCPDNKTWNIIDMVCYTPESE